MQTKWLAILAVLLLVACDNPKTDNGEGDKSPTNASQSDDHGHDQSDGDGHEHEDGDDDAHHDDSDSNKEGKTEDAKSAEFDNSFKGDGDDAKVTAKQEEEPKELTLSEKFSEIKSGYNKLQSEFRKQMRSLSEEERTEELFDNHRKKSSAFGVKAFELVKDQYDREEALEICIWASSNGSDETRAMATNAILEHFGDSDQLGPFVNTLARGMASETNLDTLKKLSTDSPHKEIKAAATYGLISVYSNIERFQDIAEKNPELELPDFVVNYDLSGIDQEKLYVELIENFGDVSDGNRTYKEIAEPALFEIQHLSIGKIAPDIEGKDLDGEAFKLSDYRGKVVVLDFWGDW